MRRYCGGILALVLVCGCADEEVLATERHARVGAVQAALDQELAEADADATVRVIINLQPPMSQRARSLRGRAAFRVANAALQDDMLAAYGDGLSLSRRYKHVPALAGRLSKRALDRWRRDPRVEYIQLDSPGSGQLKEAVPAIGADQLHDQQRTGQGVTVAVLDTGIDSDHPDLKESVVAQHCFTQRSCAGFSSEAESAEDDHGHGSNVAGIITSDGVVASTGFAPNADIVAVKINDANDSGYESDWVAGLDWIYDNLEMLDVKVINMSICTNQLFADAAACDQGEPAMAKAVKNLVDAGVVLFSSSGNRGESNAMSAPACNTGVIAVGATYDSDVGVQPPGGTTYRGRWNTSFADCADSTTAFDQVTCFTNSPQRLDLVAPGAPMLSDGLNGRTETYWGTSQASPVAAAVAALMLECSPGLLPEQIKQVMIETAVPVIDAKNNRTFPSLRALGAVQRVCGDDITEDAGTGAGGAGGMTGEGGAASAGAGAGGMQMATGGAAAPAGAGGMDGIGGSIAVSGAGGAAMETAGMDGSAAGGSSAMQAPEPVTRRAEASCGCSIPGTRSDTRAAWWLSALALCLARRRARSYS